MSRMSSRRITFSVKGALLTALSAMVLSCSHHCSALSLSKHFHNARRGQPSYMVGGRPSGLGAFSGAEMQDSLSSSLARGGGSTADKRNHRRTTASSSALFSSSGGGNVTPSESRKLKNLGKLTMSGLMAFAYMRYQQMVVLSSVGYFLVWRVGVNGRKTGMKPVVRDMILVGGIFGALQITQRLLGPVKMVVELLVTAFFSYMFLLIASKKDSKTA